MLVAECVEQETLRGRHNKTVSAMCADVCAAYLQDRAFARVGGAQRDEANVIRLLVCHLHCLLLPRSIVHDDSADNILWRCQRAIRRMMSANKAK